MTNLGGHCFETLFEAFDHAAASDKRTCFLAYTVKGHGLNLAGHRLTLQVACGCASSLPRGLSLPATPVDFVPPICCRKCCGAAAVAYTTAASIALGITTDGRDDVAAGVHHSAGDDSVVPAVILLLSKHSLHHLLNK